MCGFQRIFAKFFSKEGFEKKEVKWRPTKSSWYSLIFHLLALRKRYILDSFLAQSYYINSFYIGDLLSKLSLLNCLQNLSHQTLNKTVFKTKGLYRKYLSFSTEFQGVPSSWKHRISIMDYTNDYQLDTLNFYINCSISSVPTSRVNSKVNKFLKISKFSYIS